MQKYAERSRYVSKKRYNRGMTTKLSLNKVCKGLYEKTVGELTIHVSNPGDVTGEKSEWQLVIDEGNDELAVNEWFPTKRQCYKFAVNWLMTFSD